MFAERLVVELGVLRRRRVEHVRHARQLPPPRYRGGRRARGWPNPLRSPLRLVPPSPWPLPPSSPPAGIFNLTVVPFPGSLATSIAPPCPCATCLTIDSPSPVPPIS